MPKLPNFPGPTGTSEHAPFNEDDKGGLMAALTVHPDKGKVLMRFGADISFLVMTAGEAEAWGQRLLDAAKELRAREIGIERDT